MIRAAGILFRSKAGSVLFLKRGNGSDHPNEWAFPGGRMEPEDRDDPVRTAIRETLEETGFDASKLELRSHTRGVAPAELIQAAGDAPSESVDFETFVAEVDQEFVPTLCDEHQGWAWAAMDAAPEPLHPGARLALDRFGMNELDIAEAMAAGRLVSPQVYENVTLFDMRITGVGLSYRVGLKEHVWRDPAYFTSERFLKRCNGLPIIMEHPPGRHLDSKEFGDRIVGTVFLPYLKGDEPWGIVKSYDDAAIKMMTDAQLSTSPGVVFTDPSVNTKIALEDGNSLLIEGEPGLLDHLAICALGVWDKGGTPSGIVVNDSAGAAKVAEKTEAEEREDKARRDAEEAAAREDAAKKDAARRDEAYAKMDAAAEKMGALCDSVASRLDAFGERLDALGKRMDAAEAGRMDGETEEERKDREAREDSARRDAEEAKEREDAARRDAEEAEKKADAARKDAQALEQRLADLERVMPRAVTNEERRAMLEAQSRADAVFMAMGSQAPPAMAGEDLNTYRRRLAHDLRGYSRDYANANVFGISDAATFDVAERTIYNDAMVHARSPDTAPAGELRPVMERQGGHDITRYYGRTSAWTGELSGGRWAVGAIQAAGR